MCEEPNDENKTRKRQRAPQKAEIVKRDNETSKGMVFLINILLFKLDITSIGSYGYDHSDILIFISVICENIFLIFPNKIGLLLAPN